MIKRVIQSLQDILDAINLIDVDVAQGEQQFFSDLRTQASTQYRLVQIGEAANRIYKSDPEFETNHPDIKISQAIAVRILLTHEYERIETWQIWDIAVSDIPKLKAAVEKLLATELPSSTAYVEHRQRTSKDFPPGVS